MMTSNNKDNNNVDDEIIDLNVGGRKFTTSKNTLCSVSDTFFTALLMSGISSYRDKSGAIFIDRDPDLFSIILNYLRTKKLHNVNDGNLESLIDEAKFFCITPLIKKLENFMSPSSCVNNILFESLLKSNQQQLPIEQMIPFDRGLAVVFKHLIKFYFFCDNNEWKCVSDFTYIEGEIELVDFVWEISPTRKLLMAIYSKEITLWNNYDIIDNIYNNNDKNNNNNNNQIKFVKIAQYNLQNCKVDTLFFIRSQLVTLCKKKGRIGIWKNLRLFENNVSSKITAYNRLDYLFLCSNRGVIYLIDIQKLPFRLIDGDLLINEFYKDPDRDTITAISSLCSFCSRTNCYRCSHYPCEISYGTKSGAVHILVMNPDTAFKEPQLFHTIRVHLSPILKIMSHEKYLLTMCYNLHVRTWSLVRFRGKISTQPGLEPESSYVIRHSSTSLSSSNHHIKEIKDIGPYGHQEGIKQVFVEIPHDDCNYANIISAYNGDKLCTLNSVDGSPITSVCGLSIDIRDRNFIFTGHKNGNVQVWDPNPALKQKLEDKQSSTSSSTTSNAAAAATSAPPTTNESIETINTQMFHNLLL